MVVSLLFAPAAATEASATRAVAMRASPLFIEVLSLSLGVSVADGVNSSPYSARRGLTRCDTRVTKWLPGQSELLARPLEQEASGEARDQHEHDQHEGCGPRLLMQDRVCRLGVQEDRE